jgi:hypothetical protein
MNRIPERSAQLASIGYDVAKGVLEVEFRKGGIYQYVGVCAETHRQLLAAPSIGTYFNEMIREGSLVYRRVSESDVRGQSSECPG